MRLSLATSSIRVWRTRSNSSPGISLMSVMVLRPSLGRQGVLPVAQCV
jgi:hypothetical protein